MIDQYKDLIFQFNKKKPVGSPVKLEYNNDIINTTVREEAFVFPYNNIPVAFFEDIAGVVDIRKVIE